MATDERVVRQARARASLDGLSVGDAFGERFFGETDQVIERIRTRTIDAGPWRYTDDTEMALSIVELLEENGTIDQDELAKRFARRMDPSRGYGKGAFEVLSAIHEGRPWRAVARNSFRGMGSFGNGSAMRVAPLGAYFSDDVERAIAEAALTAEVTHSHPEGIAGAIAVAVATAILPTRSFRDGDEFLTTVLRAVPKGYTHDAIAEALALPEDADVIVAAKALGNGSGVTVPDTVPLCLWVVARQLEAQEPSFEDALWTTVSALGDRDTTCAIVGGILVGRTGVERIPVRWLAAREALPI